MNFLIKTLKGMIIGIAAMTAGAGTFAIVFGVYDKCMQIIAKPFKGFKNNLIYITPIILGILISVLVFGKGIIYLLNHYDSYVKFAFLGIIIGGIPMLFRISNKKGFNKKYVISLILAFIVTLLIPYFTSSIQKNMIVDSRLSIISLFIFGLIYGFGAIAPGMTTIHLLIYWGVLGPIMDGIFSFDFQIILPFGIGYLLIVLLTANLITYLFKRFYGYTYYVIIGFTITSLSMLIPRLTSTIEYILGPIIAIIFAISVYYLTKLDLKYQKNKE